MITTVLIMAKNESYITHHTYAHTHTLLLQHCITKVRFRGAEAIRSFSHPDQDHILFYHPNVIVFSAAITQYPALIYNLKHPYFNTMGSVLYLEAFKLPSVAIHQTGILEYSFKPHPTN